MKAFIVALMTLAIAATATAQSSVPIRGQQSQADAERMAAEYYAAKAKEQAETRASAEAIVRLRQQTLGDGAWRLRVSGSGVIPRVVGSYPSKEVCEAVAPRYSTGGQATFECVYDVTDRR